MSEWIVPGLLLWTNLMLTIVLILRVRREGW